MVRGLEWVQLVPNLVRRAALLGSSLELRPDETVFVHGKWTITDHQVVQNSREG